MLPFGSAAGPVAGLVLTGSHSARSFHFLTWRWFGDPSRQLVAQTWPIGQVGAWRRRFDAWAF